MSDPTTREALAKVAHDHWGYSSDSPGEYECDCGELTKNPQEHIALKIIEASGYRPAHEVAEPVPYLPPDLYNDLQGHLLSARSGDAGLFLANRLMEATGASELRRRQRDRAAFPTPTEEPTKTLASFDTTPAAQPYSLTEEPNHGHRIRDRASGT